MPQWEDLPVLSSAVPQTGTADEAGNIIGGSTIDAPSVNIDPRISDFILYGVFNGAFARPPNNPDEPISDINQLPDWTGPTQVSGGAITCQWVVDAASPSGYNLRFSIAAGAAGDEAYVEQIVPIGGDRQRRLGGRLSAVAYRVSVTGGTPLLTLESQLLTAAGVATGSAVTKTTSLSVDATLYTVSAFMGTPSSPGDAAFARVRVGIRRNTMAATDTATIDLVDIRNGRMNASIPIADAFQGDTRYPGYIYQDDARLFIIPNYQEALGATYIGINGATGDIALVGGDILLSEVAAPGTPASGYYAIYAKTDGILYGKNDAGTETALGGGSSTVSGCIVTRTSNLSVSTGSLTLLTWPTEERDTDAYHSTGSNTNRLVAPFTGWYSFAFQIDYDAGFGTAGRSVIDVITNSDTPATGLWRNRTDFSTSGTPSHSAGGIIYLSASDYISASIYQASGGTRQVQGRAAMVYLGA